MRPTPTNPATTRNFEATALGAVVLYFARFATLCILPQLRYLRYLGYAGSYAPA
jgi:hypothetical protein